MQVHCLARAVGTVIKLDCSACVGLHPGVVRINCTADRGEESMVYILGEGSEILTRSRWKGICLKNRLRTTGHRAQHTKINGNLIRHSTFRFMAALKQHTTQTILLMVNCVLEFNRDGRKNRRQTIC